MFRSVLSKKNRALLGELVRTDFKLRYQGSVLGYAWSLLYPLFIFLILYIVFVYFLKFGKGIPHYPIYLLLGVNIWNFFREVTSQGLGSIVGRGDLIRKIRIPRWIIVFSTSLSAVINLLLNLLVVGIFLVINHVSLHISALWLLPLILEVYLLALGIALFLSAAYVKFRDLNYIWDVIMQAGFYITPIIYPLSRVPHIGLQKIIMLNPIAQAIQDSRYSVVSHYAKTSHQVYDSSWPLIIPYAIVTVVLVGGIYYFKKESKNFAENV